MGKHKPGRKAKPFDVGVAQIMHDQGESFKSIGEHFGMGGSSAHKRFHEGGGTVRKRKTKALVHGRRKTKSKSRRKTCTGPCAKQKTINEKNFGNSVKSLDGFMHVCRECMSAKQTEVQAARKRNKSKNGYGRPLVEHSNGKAAGLEDAQRALALSSMGMPDTDGETLWLLRGAAMAEGITVIELVQKMLNAYRGARA